MFKQNRLIYKKTPETKGAVPEKPEAPKVHAKNRQVLGDTIGASLKTPKKKPEEAFDYKTLLDKKLTPKQLEKLKEVRSTIPANAVLKLQENNPDIIAQLYCEPPDTSKEWTFNPHRNSSINRSIGLVNIYKNSFGVRNVKVTKPNGTEILGERSGLAGDFHTEQGHYLQILSGYKVEVKKTLPKNETQKLEKQFKEESKTYTASLEGNIPEKLEKQHGKDLAKKITETGLRQGVDPRYLLALLRQENGEKGYEFGIIGYSERAGFLNQLRWAATIVKNNEYRYKSLGVKPKDSKNRYTLGFLAFLSERYAPLSSSPVNAPHFENTKSIYQKLAGNAPLEGNPEDVRKGRELAKNSFLWANKSQIYSYIRNQYYKGTEAQADEPQATADVNVTGIRNLNYRFTALKNHKLYPAEGRPGQRIGNFCCAYSVSTWLGLGEDSGDKRGKPGNVGRLAAKLIKGNMERTNGADNGMIKTGIETLERGDVTIFGNFNSLHHVGLITFNKRIEIRDENGDSLGHHEIIGFNHTGKRINFDPMLIVASGNKRVMKALHASLQNPDFRNKHPELQEMWEIQGPGKRISITDKREWQKKAGKYAFAIRTRNLQAPESMIA